jgi:hypothetical protein
MTLDEKVMAHHPTSSNIIVERLDDGTPRDGRT